MTDRNNWERERMREEDRNREPQFTGGEERNRNWEREGRYGHEGRREFEGSRDPYFSGSEGRWNEGRWNEGRGYGGERGYEGSRGFEGSRGNEGSRGYNATRAYEGSRGGYEGIRGAYEGSREDEGWRGGARQGDYGPGAFNRQFRGGPEFYGAGHRGYGTTWGGQSSYSGGQGAFSGGIGTYSDQGRFAGRGPKGFQRSDERIREDICERLTQHPEIDAVDIEIQVKNGEVILTGTVDHRDEKRMAEDVAESVFGVKDVHNQLRAQQHQGVTAGQSGQGFKQETSGGTATKTK